MSSSQNSGSRSRSVSSSTPTPQLRCYHNDIAPIRTIRVPGPTYGKRFYGCVHWPYHCGFFKFADEADEVAELQYLVFERDVTIGGLELERDSLVETVKQLRERNWKLEEEVAELAIENCEKLEAMQKAKYDKKLLFLLFCSWVFMAVKLLVKSG